MWIVERLGPDGLRPHTKKDAESLEMAERTVFSCLALGEKRGMFTVENPESLMQLVAEMPRATDRRRATAAVARSVQMPR